VNNFKRIAVYATVATAAVFATGCATNDKVRVAYYEYLKAEAEAKKAIGVAQAQKESVRYMAAAKAVENADSSAKAAASVALGVTSGTGSSNQPAQTSPRIQAPETTEQVVFRWASLLTNGVVPAVIDNNRSKRQAEVAIVQSNNAASVQKDTNATMLGLGLGSQAFQAAAPLEFSGAGVNIVRELPPAEEVPAE
jgi:hypothetical protein